MLGTLKISRRLLFNPTPPFFDEHVRVGSRHHAEYAFVSGKRKRWVASLNVLKSDVISVFVGNRTLEGKWTWDVLFDWMHADEYSIVNQSEWLLGKSRFWRPRNSAPGARTSICVPWQRCLNLRKIMARFIGNLTKCCKIFQIYAEWSKNMIDSFFDRSDSSALLSPQASQHTDITEAASFVYYILDPPWDVFVDL